MFTSSSSSSSGSGETTQPSSPQIPHHQHDEEVTMINTSRTNHQNHDSMIMMETTLPPQIIINTNSSSNGNSSNSTPSDDSESCNRSEGVSFTPISEKEYNPTTHNNLINNNNHNTTSNSSLPEGISPISIGLSDTVVRVPNNSHPLEDNAITVAKELLRVKIGGDAISPKSDVADGEMQKHHHKFPFDHGFQSAASIDLDGCSTRTIVKKPKKKTLFSVFQHNTEPADEEPIVYTFFDLEKPAKKKAKKTKKGVIAAIYKVAILTILFSALSSIVIFGIAMDNSNSDQIGYFTAGSPTTIVWTGAFQMAFSLIFLFDLFGPLFLLRWYKRIVSFIEKRGIIKDNFTRQINIDGYSIALFARIFWGVIIFITCLINWVCYGLYSENRERLSGWLCLFFIISPLSYLVIAYHQFRKFRKANIIIFELKEEKWYGEESFFRTRICCRVTTVIKFLVYMFMALVCAFFIMFTIQSVSITQDEYKIPGTLYSIKPSSSQILNMHMYCEGDSESEDAVLLDSDIGVASPYAYMKGLITLLAKKGMRACVIERAGYGFSDSGPFPRDLTNTTMTEMIALVKEASFKTPFILISHSSASFTARTVMEYHRKLLRGVILLHPSHEKQDTYHLGGVYNLTDAQISNMLEEKTYMANTIRFVTPIGFTRYFSNHFYQKLPSTLGTVYERYYLNGWKTYFGSLPNSTAVQFLLKYNQHTANINKFNNVVWSELDDMKNTTGNIINLRAKRQTFHSSNSTIIPVSILTSKKLLYGSCEDNYLTLESTVCSDFLNYQQVRANAFLSMHQDLAAYYNSTKMSWKIIDADFDMALTSPNLIVEETLNLMNR